MKKLLTLFILFSAHFLLQAQPISGVPDPGFFPQDIGRIFDEEHKLYQTVTRFYRGWDGGLFVYSQHQRFLQGQGNLMLQSFTPLDKDLEHPKFAFCDRNQRFSYENRALYDYRGSKGVAQSESGFYWNFGVQNDSIYIDTISPVSVWREFRVTRSKFKIGRPFTGGAMPIGAHDEAPYLKRFWLSIDPVFYPQGEASWIVQTRGNRNWINRIFRSNHLSIQKSCVFANGDMYGACAFREGGIRSLKMVKWDTLIVPRDSFLIANSAGFTKVHLMQRDAQNRITLAFETFSGGQYSERIVRYLLNGNLDPTFQQIVLQNATPLHTHFLDNQLLVTRQTSSQLVVSRYSLDGIFISFKNFYLYENHIAHRPILNFDDGQKILFESVHPVDTRLGEEYPDNIYDSTYTVSNRFILDLQSGWQPLLKDIVAVPKNRVFDVPSIQLRKSRLANRLVYSGMFSHIFGRLSPNYAVLNPNGTLDTTYIDLTRMSKAVRDTIFKRSNCSIQYVLLKDRALLIYSDKKPEFFPALRILGNGSIDSSFPSKSYVEIFESRSGEFYATSYIDSLGGPVNYSWNYSGKNRMRVARLDSFGNELYTLPIVIPTDFSSSATNLFGKIRCEDSQGGLWMEAKTYKYSPNSGVKFDKLIVMRFFNGKWTFSAAPGVGSLFDPKSITVISGNRFRVIGNFDSIAIINGAVKQKTIAHDFLMDSTLKIIYDENVPTPKIFDQSNPFTSNYKLYIHEVQADRKLLVSGFYPYAFGPIFRLLSDGRYDPSFIPLSIHGAYFYDLVIEGNRLFIPNQERNRPGDQWGPPWSTFHGASRKNGLHVFKLNSSLQPENFVQGRVVQVPANDPDCAPNPLARGLGMKMIESAPTGRITFTDTGGYYNLIVPQGQHSVSQIIQGHELQRQTCPAPANPDYSVSFAGSGELALDKSFKNQTYTCTKLGVGMFTGRNRLCAKRTYDITYSNDGVSAEPNARIRVRLPRKVRLLNASRPFTYSADSAIVFALGNLNPGQTGRITVTDSVDCDLPANIDEQGCASIRIEPVQLCGAVTPSQINWNGAWLDAKAQTISADGAVRLVVYSKGASMTDSTRYRIEAAQFVKEGKLKLAAGDSLVIVSPPLNNYTFGFSLEQPLNCPAGRSSSLSHVGKPGSVSFLSFYDGWLQFQSYNLCEVYRFSYDPNEKVVDPKADIDPGNSLLYTIHFENYGNDTAYAVAIADTLSPLLDIRSFQMLESSHACIPMVDQNGNSSVINFLFNPIKLTAKKQDSVLSKGFVRFRIASKTTAQPGDLIPNTAHIYFDRNPAIVTNTTVSRIYTPQTPTSVANLVSNRLSLMLYPNPANGSVLISLSDGRHAGRVSVFDVRGVQVLSAQLNQGVLDIRTLKPGVYTVKMGNAHPARLVVNP